ncbi:hypothetical protein ILUMI_22430 [Ignelater luminosus]|uniref:Reverse transcriptase domain-containing protein n=1 Tax=Ignelater luminosus TaxID=2038154 RepID=A0A8K0G2M2_IGNLU|nr:hypothetical protein ILUMI_22430 [Ignelater luminosus]
MANNALLRLVLNHTENHSEQWKQWINSFQIYLKAVYIDDIIVWGKSKAEHDRTLEAVLETARKNNVKSNLSKCTFGVSELKFMGHTISDQGVAIDPDRLHEIIEFPEPKCKKDVQRLLRVVNYVSKYVPNFSEGTKPLRELLKKDTFFSWEERHKAAFTKLKNSLVNNSLSRACIPTTASEDLENNDQICVVNEAQISDEFIQKIKVEINNDRELLDLAEVIKNSELPPVKPNTKVLVQLKPNSFWRPGTVLQRLGDRRYKVSVDNKGIHKELRWSKDLVSEKKEGKEKVLSFTSSLGLTNCGTEASEPPSNMMTMLVKRLNSRPTELLVELEAAEL